METTQINRKKFAPATPAQKAEVDEKIKKLRKQGEKMRRGRFEFNDAKGGWFDFSYRFFPGDPVTTVRINHDEVTDIPELLMWHLNNVKRKVRQLNPKLLDGDQPFAKGHAIKNCYVEKVSRVSFIPMDAIEIPFAMGA